jgi:L-fucose isomerase-like protein
MLILTGTVENQPPEEVKGFVDVWPIALARLDTPVDTLIQALNANHVHLVPGDLTEELGMVGRFLGVEVIRL